MDAIILAEKHFKQNSNTHSINNFKNREIEFSNLKQIASNHNLPNKPHQIILGSLMGDMSCRREALNSKIEETHSINQKDYLIWKYSILKNYFQIHLYNINNPIYKDKNKTYIQEYHKRPDVKERMRENLRRYRHKPEYKEKVLIYKREYRKRPEVKEKIIEYNKKYRERKKGDKN